MKHIRTRRHLRFTLILLLSICIVLFVEARIEAFVPDMRSFATVKIEQALGGNVRLSVGEVGGGIFHPITISDVKITDAKNMTALPFLEIDSVKTNYSIWSLICEALAAKTRDVPAISTFLSGVSRVDISFVTANKALSGCVRMDSAADELKLMGYVTATSGQRADFTARIKKSGNFEAAIQTCKGIITARGVAFKDGGIETDFKVSHLNIGARDIACEGRLKTEMVIVPGSENKAVVIGSLEMKNLAVNYKSFLDLKVSYRISNGLLEIADLSAGDILKVSGTFQMREPYGANIQLTANNLSLSWLALALGAKDGPSILSGTMNGKFGFKGPLAGLRSDAQFEIRKGAIGGLEFEALNARIKGEGPVVRIEDSRITRESGYFVLAGEMDLRRLGKASFFDNIKLVGDDQAVNWDGWDTSKIQNIRHTSMKKKINDDISLGFKNLISEDTIDESLKYGDEVQLEYKLHPNDSLMVTVGQDKDFLGIEHKDKF